MVEWRKRGRSGGKDNPLVLLPVGASLGQPSASTSGLAEDGSTRPTKNNSLGVREDGGDVDASRALDIHKVAVGRLHETLQLVLACFGIIAGVEEIVFELFGIITTASQKPEEEEGRRGGSRKRGEIERGDRDDDDDDGR